MRTALTDLVNDLDTDTSSRICSFSVNLDELDIGSKLNDLAKTNDHIAGWSLVSQEPINGESLDSDADQPADPSALPDDDLSLDSDEEDMGA